MADIIDESLPLDTDLAGYGAKNIRDSRVAINDVKIIADAALPKAGGTITGDLVIIGSLTGGGFYDYIVDSQSKFNALVASGTWLEAKNVLFTCNVARTGAVVIPATVEKIHAINGATLTTSSSSYTSALSYASIPTDIKYEMVGLKIIHTGSAEAYGFRNILNIRDCYAEVSGTYSSAFVGCSRLINCIGYGGGDHGVGFENCSQLINCNAIGTGTVEGYGFLNCLYTNGCRKDGACTTSLWVGTNTFRDDQSCDLS